MPRAGREFPRHPTHSPTRPLLLRRHRSLHRIQRRIEGNQRMYLRTSKPSRTPGRRPRPRPSSSPRHSPNSPPTHRFPNRHPRAPHHLRPQLASFRRNTPASAEPPLLSQMLLVTPSRVIDSRRLGGSALKNVAVTTYRGSFRRIGGGWGKSLNDVAAASPLVMRLPYQSANKIIVRRFGSWHSLLVPTLRAERSVPPWLALFFEERVRSLPAKVPTVVKNRRIEAQSRKRPKQ